MGEPLDTCREDRPFARRNPSRHGAGGQTNRRRRLAAALLVCALASAPLARALPRTTPLLGFAPICGNGVLDPGEQCDDGNLAAGDCCSPACRFEPVGTACDDGDACTQTDTCQAGVCAGGSPIVCQVQDQCHELGTCDPQTGTCSNPAKPAGTICDDQDDCTQNDACRAGVCQGLLLTGVEGVLCALEPPPPLCAGDGPPPAINRLMGEVMSLLVQAELESNPRVTLRLLRKAMRKLQRFLRLVTRAEKKRAVSAKCVRQLRDTLRDAMQRLEPLTS